MSQARIGDIERRLCNIIRPGVISDVDYSKARVKVKVGDNTTAWLPWLTGRAGGDVSWHAPEKGEQVLVLSPAGEMATGFVVPSVYQKNYPANGSSADVSITTFKDGAFVKYDRSSSAYTIGIPTGGTVKLSMGSSTITIDGSGINLKG